MPVHVNPCISCLIFIFSLPMLSVTDIYYAKHFEIVFSKSRDLPRPPDWPSPVRLNSLNCHNNSEFTDGIPILKFGNDRIIITRFSLCLTFGGLEKDRLLVSDVERTSLRELNLRIRRGYVPAS